MGNNDSKIPFVLPDKENIFEEYLGGYVRIQNSSNSYAGKLIKIEDDCYGVLSPFVGKIYSENKRRLQIIEGEKEKVFLLKSNIEPTTRENIENMCLFENNNPENNIRLEDNSKDSSKQQPA